MYGEFGVQRGHVRQCYEPLKGSNPRGNDFDPLQYVLKGIRCLFFLYDSKCNCLQYLAICRHPCIFM